MRSVPEQILRGVLIGIVLYILFGVLGCFDSGNEMLPEVIKSLEAPPADPFGKPVRVFYVEDVDGQHSDEVESRLLREIRKSQEFFANQMEMHGHGRRTFELRTGEIERVNLSKHENHYRDSFDEADPGALCRDHDRTEKRSYSLLKELNDLTDDPDHIDLHIYIIDFQLQCFEGLAFFSASFFDSDIFIDASDQDILYEIISHEIGHIYDLMHDKREYSFMSVPYRLDWQGQYRIYEDQADRLNDF